MIPITTPAEMRAVDAAAPEPVEVLIARAGAEVARSALDLLGGAYGRRVVVLAGPGNNGADGIIAAERLVARGVRVEVIDPRGEMAVRPDADLVIDAAFGTGMSRPWTPPEVRAPVLAVDIPSGVDGLTGELHGSALPAVRTVTFAALKPGLLLGAGPPHAGEIELADIGLDVGLPSAALVESADVAAWVAPRPADAHKWRSGVRVVAGSPGMDGAGLLAAGAAMRGGAGIVHASSPGIGARWPQEVVSRTVAEVGWAAEVLDGLDRFGAAVVGPGLGRSEATRQEVGMFVAGASVPLVLDADALWFVDAEVLRRRAQPTVVTPHDGEFATMTGARPGADRFDASRRLAEDLGVVVVLKGPTTVIADPGGHVLAVDEGDQRLATAGSGDVLTGLIGAYLARGVPALSAAAAAVFVHGRAARLAGGEGVVAGDLLLELGGALESCR
ncbi:MAG: NAD(P)H-hydrate dehydratase [Actinomycetota bacterium]